MTRLPIYAPPPTRGHCIEGTPTTGSRADRLAGRAQCRAYGCRYNELVQHADDMPGRRHDGRAPEWTFYGESRSASAPSCALDIADQGKQQCSDLERKLGQHRRRYQQLVRQAIAAFECAATRMGLDAREVIRAWLEEMESER